MESDRSLQQKVAVGGGGGGGGGGGRSKLSLRRKKDKDPPTQQHPSPPPNPTNLSLRITPCDILTIITPKASKTTSTNHCRESGRDLDTSTHNKTAPVKKLKPGGTSDDVECVPLDAEREEMGKDERTEMELQHVPSPHTSTHDKTAPMKKLKPGGTDDDVEYISLDEEREEMGIDERTRMELQQVSSPHPDRLVQLMRESKKTSPAVMDSVASSGMQESSSSSRTVGEGERGEPLQTRRSKRLVDQSGKGGKQGKGLEATSILSREDEDFAMPPSDERTKMELQQVSSPHPADIDDDDEGLGDFYFCHICQKDLTRFSESRRQTHINRCCDKQEEEKESVAAAAAKEGQSSAVACLLCKKSFKSDNARMTHVKSCAKSKGVAPDRLVQLMRESKKTSPAIMDSAASSGVQESSSSSRMEGEGEGERGEPLQTRRSKRLVDQSGKGGKQGKGLAATSILSREDEDFAMPHPVGHPAGSRGRKRKRDNLQDNYLEELEEEQLRLAIALSASMESGGDAAPPVYGGETSDADQRKGRKRQKRKNAAAEVVPPLLTVTTEQADNIINQRAEEILRRSETADNNTGALEPDDNDIPCTPAFQESELGGGGGGGGEGGGSKYKPAAPMKPGTTTVGGQEGREDDDEVVLVEERDEKQLEIDDESAVKPGDACLADGGASPKSTDEVLSNDGKETGPVKADTDNVTKSGEKVVDDDEAMSLGDESEHSESEDTPLAAETNATEHGISFHEDLQEVDYPTLWQLTAEETQNVEHFYVPALVPVVSPVKAEQTRCKVCEVEPCLALTLQAVPTIPMENQCWEVSPIQQTTDSSQVSRDHPAIDQLLSDLGSLVGSSLFSNVQIQTGSGPVIPAHAVILAARCPKLRQVIQQSQATPISLDFSEFDDDSILAFLRFIYTGSSPTETEDNAELRHNFSLFLDRWYSDKGGERKDDESLPVDQESLTLKSVSSSQLKDSTITMANAGMGGSFELASPRLSRSFQTPEPETPQSNERAHPVAEKEGENLVIIENSDNSDSLELEIEKSPASDLKSKEKHTEVKNSAGVHHMKFDSLTEELSPIVKVGDSDHLNDHLGRSGHHTSNGSSPELKRDCSLRRRRGREQEGAGESSVRRRSSSEWSHPRSHISLSSVDSNEVVICKTPTTLLSPGERGGKGSSSSCDLFCTSLGHYSENECISEGEREGETVESEEESERTVESIVVESSSSSRTSSVVPLASPHSPHLIEKQGKASPDNWIPGSSIVSIPDISIPKVSIPDISITDVTTPDVSVPNVTTPDFSIPDYTPVDDYSFGAFDDDIISYPSASFEQEPMEPAPRALKLVTPVNDRTVTMVPESIDTVKRKPQCFKTPANCGVELQTDDDITPMPDFKSMRTPCLKGECARFGVKAMPKKKMIAKLSEIYEHTHPLVDAEGRVVSVDSESLEDGSNTKTSKQRPADKTKTKAGRTKKAGSGAGVAEGSCGQKRAAHACSVNELKLAVLKYFKSDKQLYQDILLFKPMELSYFCTKVKSAGISVAKEKLADILDNLCITYTVPRQQRTGKKLTQEKIS